MLFSLWDHAIKSITFFFILTISSSISILALMLLLANLANTKWCKNPEKMIEILANGYSSESSQRELSNEYQHDSVSMVFKNLCILVLWTKVSPALEVLGKEYESEYHAMNHHDQLKKIHLSDAFTPLLYWYSTTGFR